MATFCLSIVIPVYNEEKRLPQTLDHLLSFLSNQTYEYEVVIVENGSRDHTWEIAKDYARRFPQVRIFQERLKGKGWAVRRGMLEAVGDYRFMCDSDFSMPIDHINRFLPPMSEDFEVVIGSREAPGAHRVGEPIYRHLVGRVFNLMIRIFALPGLHDTQCGFKCFKSQAAEVLFQKQTLKGWSFDVEVLFIARLLGYKVNEIPIPWYFNPESKVKVIRDSAQMAFDLFVIRWNSMRGIYRQA